MLESGWSAGSSSSCWNAMAAWAWRSEARVTLVQVCDALGLPGVPARDPGVEVRRTGHGRPAGDGRRLVDDPGRAAQAPGLRRGLVVLPVHGRDRQPPWDKVDWKADPDWDWHSAAEDSPEQLQTLWQDAVARSRSLVTEALADGGLERLARRT